MTDVSVKITINKNASAKIECEKAEIIMPDGSTIVKEGRFFLCRCGTTKNAPFCDGAHKECGFQG